MFFILDPKRLVGLKSAPGVRAPGTQRCRMTASDTNRSRSDNSVLEPNAAGDCLAPERDPRLRSIIEYTTNHGSTTQRDLSAVMGWPLREIDRHHRRLEDAGLAKLIDEGDCRIVLLTVRGEQLVQEGT